MKIYDMTERVAEAHEYFDKLLDERIAKISEISGVPLESFKKINPADFIEKNKYQTIRGYNYINIKKWIIENKTADDIFLISPTDAIEETASQCSYKQGTDVRRKIRASKCEVVPCATDVALDFFIRNHRQSLPVIRDTAVCFALMHKSEIVAVMLYDISNGAVRGKNKKYELVRLSIAKGTMIYGGASKLQTECENTFRKAGIKEVYSYSNATINSGTVYQKLGFELKRIGEGQPFVILRDNEIVRLIVLYPNSTDKKLAFNGWLKTHLGGNKVWVKKIPDI